MTSPQHNHGRAVSHDVAIVGGGITGLAAAYLLRRSAPHLEVVLVERSGRLGGKIVTDRRSLFVLEGGADAFLASKPEAVALAEDLGMSTELMGTNADWRRTYVLQSGSLKRIPEGLTGLVPSRLEPFLQSDLLSTEGKHRLTQEPLVPVYHGDDEETLAAFVERRFGHEIYRRLIEPLMAGIYAGDGANLSLDATFPQLRRLEIEYGSVLLGLRAASTDAEAATGKPAPASGFLTPRWGMGQLVDALVQRLDSVDLVTNTRVLSVNQHGLGYDLHLSNDTRVSAKVVILAAPAFAAAEVLEMLAPDASALLESISYVSTATIVLAYRSDEIGAEPDGFGYIVPRDENRAVLAGTWTSHKFNNRAPPDHFLARLFVGRAGMEVPVDSSNDDLISMCRDELRDIARVRAAPRLTHIYRWPRAMPQYTVGHRARVQGIETALRAYPGLFVAGHAYSGVGVPDCIRSGQEAARKATRAVEDRERLRE